LGGTTKSQGFRPSAGAHWRHPVAGWQWAKIAAAGFTESADILSAFPWAERRKAKVFIIPLMHIGDILSPGGSGRRSLLLALRKAPTSCRPILGRNDEKPRFSSFRWCSLATSCRRVAGTLAEEDAASNAATRTSEGLPVPLSELRKQAKPGWRSAADVQ
jgi:hypothetical protein